MRAARAGLGWMQSQLAERAGVHAGTIKMIEGGRAKPVPATAKGLAKGFGAAGVCFGADRRSLILPS